jgi:release factor glutamine methyltransferase
MSAARHGELVSERGDRGPSWGPGTAVRSWRWLLRDAEARLGSASEARWVLERATGWEGAELWLHIDEAATVRGAAFLDAMVGRRAAGEPLQYVLGRWRFRRLDLFLDRRVLIPRPETEVVGGVAVAELRRRGDPRPVVVDLGTGSGALGLSVADEVAGARVWCTDISPEALAVARANLAGLGSRTATRVRLVEGSWWAALPSELRGMVDLAVSNPPYVAAGEVLPAEVADWEPVRALRAGPTGLEAVESILAGALEWLTPAGAMVVEIAPWQAEPAGELARAAGFGSAEVRPDLAGRPRVLVARAEP